MLSDAQLTAVGRHIAQALGTPEARIAGVRRFHGGASRETYAIDIEAGGTPQALILRCDPGDSLIETPRALEFAAYRSFEESDVPVPRAISLCDDPALIGSPFFVMERIEGGEAVSPFTPDAYGEHRDAIGRQFFGENPARASMYLQALTGNTCIPGGTAAAETALQRRDRLADGGLAEAEIASGGGETAPFGYPHKNLYLR